MDTTIERTAATTTARLAAVTEGATRFWNIYRKQIMMGAIAAILGFIIYNTFFRREGFSSQQHFAQGYPQDYSQGYQQGYQQGYPQGYPHGYIQTDAQGYIQGNQLPYIQDENQRYPGKMSPEGFYGQTDQQVANQGAMIEPKKIILFYAPWCPHCQNFMDKEDSIWETFRRKHGNRQDLLIDQIDCDQKPEAATKYGIGGYPTIKLFHGDKSYIYDGDRTLESLERFAEAPSN